MAGLIPRKCIYCQISDTDPKHEKVHPGHVSVYAHHDCCAEITQCGPGLGYEGCVSLINRAGDKRGQDLRDFILGR